MNKTNFPQKFTFCPQPIFDSLFLHEDGRICKKRLSKLHHRFRRYTSLIKIVWLESQCLQSYDGLVENLA